MDLLELRNCSSTPAQLLMSHAYVTAVARTVSKNGTDIVQKFSRQTYSTKHPQNPRKVMDSAPGPSCSYKPRHHSAACLAHATHCNFLLDFLCGNSTAIEFIANQERCQTAAGNIGNGGWLSSVRARGRSLLSYLIKAQDSAGLVPLLRLPCKRTPMRKITSKSTERA